MSALTWNRIAAALIGFAVGTVSGALVQREYLTPAVAQNKFYVLKDINDHSSPMIHLSEEDLNAIEAFKSKEKP